MLILEIFKIKNKTRSATHLYVRTKLLPEKRRTVAGSRQQFEQQP